MPCAAFQYVEEKAPGYNPSAWEVADVCLDPIDAIETQEELLAKTKFDSWYTSKLDNISSKIEIIYLGLDTKSAAFERFTELVRQWKEETWHLSSLRKRVSHIAHLKIIGLGTVAIPWILAELKREPDYWFPALEAITQLDLAPRAETMTELRVAWLEWGRVNGYID